MARKGAVFVTGDKQLDRALEQFEPKLQKKGIRKALREAGKIVQADAKRRAPVQSGTFKRAIKIRSAASRRGRRSARRRVGISIQIGEGFFMGATFYGGFVELGTKFMRARRVIRSALFENEDKVKRNFRQRLAEALKQIASEENRKSKRARR